MFLNKCFLFLLLCSIPSFSGLIQPTDLEFVGAFRIPNNTNWDYGGDGLTFYPEGDSAGPKDGFPGSLFGLGKDLKISEISIPIPKNSKDLNSLNRATQLQAPKSITTGIYSTEYPQMEIAYLPKQGSQQSGKIHSCYADWYNVADAPIAAEGWHNTNLTNPDSKGAWYLGNVSPHSICDYMFDIPKEWSDKYAPGMRLVTGKQREGGRGGVGPSLHVFGPWLQGNPPPNKTKLNVLTLLQYAEPNGAEAEKFKGHSVGDKWKGGAWLSSGTNSAVVITGDKGLGDDFYGELCGVKGYHALGGYRATILFYSPDQLAEVAQGKRPRYNLQPYAQYDFTSFLYKKITSTCTRPETGGLAYDRENGILYMVSRTEGIYNERPIILVWRLTKGGVTPLKKQSEGQGLQIHIESAGLEKEVSFQLPTETSGEAKPITLLISDSSGKLVKKIIRSTSSTTRYVWRVPEKLQGLFHVKANLENVQLSKSFFIN